MNFVYFVMIMESLEQVCETKAVNSLAQWQLNKLDFYFMNI